MQGVRIRGGSTAPGPPGPLVAQTSQRRHESQQSAAHNSANVSQAIFSLVGVIIGVGLTVGLQYVLQRRAEAREARAAARLMRDALENWYIAEDPTVNTLLEEWRVQRDVLARTLDNAAWAVVAESVRARMDDIGPRQLRDLQYAAALALEGAAYGRRSGREVKRIAKQFGLPYKREIVRFRKIKIAPDARRKP
jgi:predicted polyphosphate/ATP-dependent NAD kinase